MDLWLRPQAALFGKLFPGTLTREEVEDWDETPSMHKPRAVSGQNESRRRELTTLTIV